MNEQLGRVAAALRQGIWSGQLSKMPRWRAAWVGPLRLLAVLVRDLAYGQLNLRAMGLVYTTLLSIVPLLALSFSVLKAFGVSNQVDGLLRNFLAPLGEKSGEVTGWILKFIQNLNVGVLSSIGLALLIYTVISLIQKIEESFNFIWHVPQLRSLARRFSGYLSVLLIGPVLILAGIGVATGVMGSAPVRELLANEPLGQIAVAVGKIIPFLIVVAVFMFIYVFGPNTKVHKGSALLAAVVAGALWQWAGRLFAEFATKSTQYAAIYSSFAILLLFLIWVYVNWLILLLGASVAFYHQHREYLVLRSGEPRLSNRMRERVGLTAIYLIGKAYHDGTPHCTFTFLTEHIGVPMHALQAVLDALLQHELLIESGEEPPAYLPARDPETITLSELLDAVRSAGEEPSLSPESLATPAELEPILRRVDHAAAEQIGHLTLKDLVASPLSEA